MMRQKIYLFGDSITEESFGPGGWGASLAHHFSRSADVVLRGYSGYNTRWALKVIDTVFPTEEDGNGDTPLAVVVFFGANDACLPDRYAAFQHVPLDEYKENLRSIFSTLKRRWPTVLILLVTPPPIDEAARLLHPYTENPSGLPERMNDTAGAYARACVDVAMECGTIAADIWSEMQQFLDWGKSFLSDGLHLTERGNKIVFKQVIEKLRDAGLCLENLPVDLPLFSDIDPNDPHKVFG